MTLPKTTLRRIASLVCSALFVVASAASAQESIIIVTDEQDDEAGYAAWLEDLGYAVTVSQSEEFRGALDATQQATLEGFDLVIVSRNTNSGDYNEPADWNGLDVPILLQSAYLLRNNRWDWQNSDGIVQRDASVMQVGSSRFSDGNSNTVPDFNHPVFRAVTISEEGEFPTVTVRSSAVETSLAPADPGAGQWLLSDTTEDSQWASLLDYTGSIGEAFYGGSSQTILNRRMFMSIGNEYNVATAEDWRSLFTADGERLLLNVIRHAGDLEELQQQLPLRADFGSVRFLDFLDRTTMEIFEMEAVAEGGTMYIDEETTVESLPAGLSGNLALKTRNVAPETVLEFAGADENSWVDTNINPADVSFPVSFSIWTNRFDDGTVRNKIFGWYFDGGDNRGELEIDASQGELQLVWWGGDSIEVPMPPANRWVQIGVVITADDARLYVDGEQVGSFGAEGSPLPLTDGSNLWIGARPNGQEDSFSGWMKEWVAIDGDIGDEGMQQLAAESGIPEGDLIQHLPLDEGEGTDVFDASANELHGELFGPFSWESTILDPVDGPTFAIGFVTDRDLTVSLAFDSNATVPEWISNHYTNSGLSVGTTAGDFDLWQRDIGARERVSLLGMDRPAGENNYWVIFSESPDAVTEPLDLFFSFSSAASRDWRLDNHHWTLQTGVESELHEGSMLTNLGNLSPESGFQTSATIRVPRLQDAGDNAVGFTLLDQADGTTGIRAEWLPRTGGGDSTLRLVDASNGGILGETPWTGLVPAGTDNDVGVSGGANESQFSVGSPVFTDSDGGVVFEENFESGGEGWTSGSDNEATDQWEIGEPTSGPGSAFEGTNVAATNLSGHYETGGEATIAWLRSPAIDLSDAGEATLRFQEFMDIDTFEENGEVFHFGVVSVLDADSLQVIDDDELASYSEDITAWSERVLDLSGAAGRRIVLEFALITDDVDTDVGDGWYIDAVEVTASGVEIASMPEKLAFDGTLNGIATERAGINDVSGSHLEFTVSDRAAAGNDGVTVFVAWDARASGLEPDWLRDNFTLTDHFVGLSGQAGEHRLWAREYADGDMVTLGGASAGNGGPFPETVNNYFVLFGDARPGLETLYTLTAEGVRIDGTWELEFSLSDADGNMETVSATTGESLPGTSFGVFARHPDAASGSVTAAPIWEVFELSMDFLEGGLPGFEAWREEHFAGQLDDPEISGPDATPAGDGVPNLVKYALDLAPFEPASSGDVHTLAVTGEGDITLIYWKRTDIGDIEFIPEVSEDLINWMSGEPAVVETMGDVDGNLQEMEATGSVSEESEKAFMRLKVRQTE